MLRALSTPLRQWRAALAALLLIAGVPLLVTVGTQVVTGLILAGHYGGDFWAADGGGDPVMLQHFMWFAGHPETLTGLLVLSGITLGPWGVAIWLRALHGLSGWRVPLRGVVRIAGCILIALSPFVLDAVALWAAPNMPLALDTALWIAAPIASLLLCIALAPQFVRAAGLPVARRPAWGRLVWVAMVAAGFAVAVQMVALGLSLLPGVVARVIMLSDWQIPYGLAAVLFMDWQALLAQLATVYALLVLLALMDWITRDPSATSASAASGSAGRSAQTQT